jgi:gluconokinase
MTAGPRAVVIMGVAGCGKSTLGGLLADRLGAPFLEGDADHPPENRAKMAAGAPLTDADRWPWLAEVGAALGTAARDHGLAVAACSALKRAYRRYLAETAGVPLVFVHVDAAPEILRRRLATRQGHFVPASLLDSQLAILDPPGADEPAITVDATRTPDELAADVRRALFAT